MSTEFQLFDGKNLSSLFKDIYDNQQVKKKNISEMIESLRKLIKSVGEATVIAPIIRDLIDSSIKNDDHLIKLATIAQRLAQAEAKGIGEDGWLSETEKAQLVREAKMQDVLRPLSGSKREQMSFVLQNVETEKLEEAYGYFIGRILKEEAAAPKSSATVAKDKVISEDKALEDAVVLATGDDETKQPIISEQQQKSIADLAFLKRIAGITS